MNKPSLLIAQKSKPLTGAVTVSGAKNAALPILASLILTQGLAVIKNIPLSSDIFNMLELLKALGAKVSINHAEKNVVVDTRLLSAYKVNESLMNSMRASILAMGPLLARFGRALVALPGGCLIGARPINYHVHGFAALGVSTLIREGMIEAFFEKDAFGGAEQERRVVLDYPSVGATENLMMFASLSIGRTVIVNAALEPEVLDLIDFLRKMGASIDVGPGAFITITGVSSLQAVEHTVIPDRLEVGTLLIAAAITGGTLSIPNARADHLDAVIIKLRDMGHVVTVHADLSLTICATTQPRAVQIKTGPYPSFPTDLQPPFLAAMTLAEGISVVEETVFENRLMHVLELKKMGARIILTESRATIEGVPALKGGSFSAHDIRGSAALVLAALCADGTSVIDGVAYWRRAYDGLEKKLCLLGASVQIIE